MLPRDGTKEILLVNDVFGSCDEPDPTENEDNGKAVKYCSGVPLDLHTPLPIELCSTTNLEEKNQYQEIKKGNGNQSPSTITTVESLSRDDCAGMLTVINTSESTSSCFLEPDGMLSSCGDERINVCTKYRDPHSAALQHPFNEDICIHKSIPQPVALPEAAETVHGEIVQFDSSGQKPLVDFDATNNRAHQSGILVYYSEKKGTIEEFDREGLTGNVGQNPSSSTASHSNKKGPSNSTASHSNKKGPRDTVDGKKINLNITEEAIRQHLGHHTRKDAAQSLGVSVSTLKRKSRLFGIKRWDRIGSTVRKPSDPDERNACPTLKPSTYGQNQMVGHLHKPNEVPLPSGSFYGICSSESSMAKFKSTPTSYDDRADERSTWPTCKPSTPGQTQMVGLLHESNEVSPDNFDGAAFWFSENSIAELLATPTVHDDCAINYLEEYLPCQYVLQESENPGSFNPASSQLPSTLTVTGPIAPQDLGPVTIKAKYRDSTIKFELALTSGLTELNEEVAMRLKLEHDSFHVEYEDEDGELISMTGNENLKNYLERRTLVHPPAKLFVRDKVVNAN